MVRVSTDWFGTPLRPLDGGYSGETFLVGDHDAEQVLRIYARDPGRSVVDASLLTLLDGVLPVPRIVDVRAPHGEQPGLLVTARLPGQRLDLVLPTASVDQRVALGVSLGRVLATLSGIPMLRVGMFDGPDLRLGDGLPSGGLGGWARHFRDGGRLASWHDDDWHSLMSLADNAEILLDGGDWGDKEVEAARSRRVLVHSDFNPKNILVDPATAEVTGLLDWEFAHAGSPYADIGNLTRFERHPDFVDAVVVTLVEHAPALAGDPVLMGRAADMWALVELAGGSPTNPVRGLATQLLLAQARAGDLMAWPWDSPRVDPVANNAVF